MLQLDMTAFNGSATDVWIYTDYTNPAQNQFVASLLAAYLPALTVGYDRCGYVASNTFEASETTYNFQLHTPNDTIATFGGQANHALKFTQLALAWLVELASDGPAAPAAATAPRAAAAR